MLQGKHVVEKRKACYDRYMETVMGGWPPLTKEEVRRMTVYESMMIMLAFGLFLVALLSYLHKK